MIVSLSVQEEAEIAQLVEHVLGKDEVTGSIPVLGSTTKNDPKVWGRFLYLSCKWIYVFNSVKSDCGELCKAGSAWR